MIDPLEPEVLKEKIEKILKLKQSFFEKIFWKTSHEF